MADASTVLSIIDTLKVTLIYGWPFILLFLIFGLKMKWAKWPVDAVIIEKRGNNLIKTNDRAGRYVDKLTGITGYKLQKAKDTLPIVNYDWVMHNIQKPTTLFDRIIHILRGDLGTIFLFRYGSKQYKPLKINENGKARVSYQEVRDKNGDPVYVNIYQPLDPRDKLGALDFEVVDWDNMNFMVQEQRASIERRKKSSELWKQILIPVAMLAITAVICIILIKFSYDFAVSQAKTQMTIEQKPADKPNIPVIGGLLP